MSRLQFIQEMIIKLRTFLLTTDPVVSISVDGNGSATYDRSGAWNMLKTLEKEEQALLKPNRYKKQIDLRGAF